MSQKIDVFLIFDLTAILMGKTRDWELFEQLGTCFIPQIVKEEIDFLCKRATEPEQEKTAREFTRFLSKSNWKINNLIADNPNFTVLNGEENSKNARLQQAIAKSIYGLAKENNEQLIVLISNQKNLRNEIENLNINNLTTLTLVQFTQWLRTKQLPINVSEKIQKINTKNLTTEEITINKKETFPTQKKVIPSNSVNSITPSTKAKVKPKSKLIQNLIAYLMAIIGFTLVILTLWYFLQPNSFNQFWQKKGLPSLPKNSQLK